MLRHAVWILAFAAAAQGCTEQPPGPPTVRRQTEAPPRNPIEVLLTSDAPADARRDGTALIVLVDASGSMADPVADGQGAPRPKMEIARRCVQSLVRQAEQFAKKNPGVPLALGIEEFSVRGQGASCREVLPLGPPDEAVAARSLARVVPMGGTPIGDAVVQAKRKLDRSGLRRLHILVVTDGQNTNGYAPHDVADVLSRLPEDRRASLYFIAFDIAAAQFQATRDAGAIVLGASNERELQQTLDYVLTGKILAEQTGTDRK